MARNGIGKNEKILDDKLFVKLAVDFTFNNNSHQKIFVLNSFPFFAGFRFYILNFAFQGRLIVNENRPTATAIITTDESFIQKKSDHSNKYEFCDTKIIAQWRENMREWRKSVRRISRMPRIRKATLLSLNKCLNSNQKKHFIGQRKISTLLRPSLIKFKSIC